MPQSRWERWGAARRETRWRQITPRHHRNRKATLVCLWKVRKRVRESESESDVVERGGEWRVFVLLIRGSAEERRHVDSFI